MCDRIHTPAISGPPVTVELVQYPETYDGPQGDQLAELLSEVASEYHRHHDMAACGFVAMVEQLACEVVVADMRYRRCDKPADRRRLAGDTRVYALGVAAAAIGLMLSIDQAAPVASEPAEAAHG